MTQPRITTETLTKIATNPTAASLGAACVAVAVALGRWTG